MTTICAECCHFVNRGDVWYDQLCGNPVVRRKGIIDVVTGNPTFCAVNSFGDKVGTDEPRPFARDVNDGACDLWERGQFLVRIEA